VIQVYRKFTPVFNISHHELQPQVVLAITEHQVPDPPRHRKPNRRVLRASQNVEFIDALKA
jgi:hypothetical protein